jgi:hypothetical protein
MSNKNILICDESYSRGHRKLRHQSRGQEAATWDWLAPHGPACQLALYVGSPPSRRMHLRHSLSRFDPRAHV